MAAVTVHSDFGAPKTKPVTVSLVSLPICHEVMGPTCHDISFLNAEF